MIIAGLFEDFDSANNAYNNLINEEYSEEDISYISSEEAYNSNVLEQNEDAKNGAATGAAAGGLLGFLAGISAVAIPGLGPVIAAGTIATTLTGAAAGALVGALVDMGLPEREAQKYANEVKEGRYLLLVDTDKKKEDEVRTIMVNNGAVDVNEE